MDITLDLEAGVTAEVGDDALPAVCFSNRDEDEDCMLTLSDALWNEMGTPDSIKMTLEARP
jgi:hypothetical protein